jgi:hypothetical protein
MESELRDLLQRKAQEMDLLRTPPDGTVRRIRYRRGALTAFGAALLIAIAVMISGGLPDFTGGNAIQPAGVQDPLVEEDEVGRGTPVSIRHTGVLDTAGWYSVPVLEPDLTLRFPTSGWTVNLIERQGYFNVSYLGGTNAMSIVNCEQGFDPDMSLASKSARVAPPSDRSITSERTPTSGWKAWMNALLGALRR